MRLEVGLAPTAIGHVGVALRRSEVGVAEHLLHGAQVGATLEQVGREGVAEEMGVDALRLETRLRGELAQDEEGARAGERPSTCVQEELRPVATIEVGASHREVATDGLGRRAPERNDALLAALADDPNDPLVEVDGALLETDRLGDAEARPVQELDERAVASSARRRPVRRRDQALDLGRRERAWKPARAPR